MSVLCQDRKSIKRTRCARGCRVWVKSITMIDRASMPVYPDKPASSERGGMSQTCQEKASQSFDRDESTMFRLPKSDTGYRRTLFIHGYEEPCFVK